MRLDQLLGDVEVLHLRGDPDLAGTDVVAVTATSQAVVPGSLFCCIRGQAADGHDLAPAAVAGGAVALLAERVLPGLDVPQAVVVDSRAAMARAAAAIHDHPSRRVPVVGVTGTNGKTTTTHLLKAILEADGRPAEVIGTLSGPRTTPESVDLQAALAGAADRGARAVALEVSSHALALRRVDAIWFSVAVFTNLSPEHLDFHSGMEDYFATKASLFSPERTQVAVVNADDPWGRRLLAAARLPTRTFSMADAAGLDLSPSGAHFAWEGEPVWLPRGGTFNVANALAAATTARELGVPAAAVAAGLSAAPVVPGRFEPVDRGQTFGVVVDYAHTPAGLEACLGAARELAGPSPARVIVVFGCGGDRDQAKRPLMGSVASRLADRVMITSDNPRSEDPRAIVDDILAGIGPERRHVVVVEADRRAAIGLALSEAAAGDVVVLAGKGHETTQVTGDGAVPFDDRRVAAEELDRLGVGA